MGGSDQWGNIVNGIDLGRRMGTPQLYALTCPLLTTASGAKMRLEREQELSFIEFNYQLLQAYDFLALNQRFDCALQVGGDDQWGNIIAGVDLIRRVQQKEAFGLTFPLMTTASGAKMGKTASGAIWLDPTLTPPYDFYQYFVNVDDRDVVRFLKLLTFEPLDALARFEQAQGADLREAKQLLAYAVTTIIHGRTVADEVAAAARAAFGGTGGGDDSALPTIRLSEASLAEGLKIVDLLASSGLAASKSAARRLIDQGGVRLGDRKVQSVEDVVRASDVGAEGVLLHAGKKHLRKLLRES
jgi:tyrosyl-tRNA synthetase